VYLASGSGGDRHHGLYTNKTATSDMRVVVWTMPTEAEDFKYMGQCIFEDVVFVVKFSPDSKWLSVGTDDACVSLLSVDNNFKKLIELAAPAGVRCMAWSYDSRFLAIGGVSKTVDVWDLAAQQLTFSLPPAADWITAIVFSPTMCELLRASFGEPVHIHTLEWEKVEVPNVGKGRRMSVQKMKSFAEVSLDGLRSKKFQRVELGNAEESAFTVIVANEKCMRRPSLLQCPPGASVVGTPQKLESIAMNVIKPCGGAEDAKSHHRASVIRLGQVVRLRADDFPQLESDTPEICWHSMDDEIEALCISRDGNLLACGGWDETLTVLSASTCEVCWRAKVPGSVTCIAWSHCGTLVVCGTDNGFVTLFSGNGEKRGEVENVTEQEFDMCINSIQFAPNSKRLAWGDLDKKVTVVNVPSLEMTAELVHDGDLKSISFSPTGTMLAAGGGTDRQYGLMDTKNQAAQMKTMIWGWQNPEWKTLGKIISPNVVTCVEFSLDEQFLAIGDGTKCTILIPHQSFKVFVELELPASVTCLAWSPCGCFILVGSACRIISLFHVHSQSLIKTLKGYKDWVRNIAFAPTYKLFAVTAHDENVTLTKRLPVAVCRSRKKVQHPRSTILIGSKISRAMKLRDDALFLGVEG